MRPGQNKRMRGRNGRKGPNPLTRSYESNGPDVKIRGTAHHVAEKYLQLARDAHSSGDPVMAESYLQHAEHYFRLIAAAQLAQAQAQPGYVRPAGEVDADELDDDDLGGVPDRFASPAERFPQQPAFNPQAMPQPNMGQPPQAFAAQPQPQPFEPQQPRPERGPRPERNYQDRPPRHEGQQDRGFQNRGPRENRFNRERNGDQPRFDRNREGGAPRENQPQPQPFLREAAPVVPEEQPSLPSFITAPARVVVPVPVPVVETAQPDVIEPEFRAVEGENLEATRFPLRTRRRRRRVEGETAPEGEAPQPTAGEAGE